MANVKRIRTKVGTLCMVIGAVLLMLALALCLYNQWDNAQAKDLSEAAATQLEAQMPEPEDKPILDDPTTMTETIINGYAYIGMLDMPDLNLSLPVMSTWSYPQLRLAPCRYSGSTITNDMVIAAHNYTSHFGRLDNLYEGAKIYFTDMNGKQIAYTVSTIEILEPTAIKDMTSGDYALTLFTCTYSGQSRMAVRCIRDETK